MASGTPPPPPMSTNPRRIGIVGFGKIGQYVYEQICESGAESGLAIAFVWNRTNDKLASVPAHLVLDDLNDFQSMGADLIIEVAHLSITIEFGHRFLEQSDFMIGSPTALADANLEGKLRLAANLHKHCVYVPSGAFWGADDIAKMADQGSLQGLRVTMSKHPSSFKLNGSLEEKNKLVGDEPTTLYEGPVRQLCPFAPANVNTMACACIAAHNLGFDRVIGRLIADKSLTSHIVDIELTGPTNEQGDSFTVRTVRDNPAAVGAVTGSATFASFYQSLRRANGKPAGVHLC